MSASVRLLLCHRQLSAKPRQSSNWKVCTRGGMHRAKSEQVTVIHLQLSIRVWPRSAKAKPQSHLHPPQLISGPMLSQGPLVLHAKCHGVSNPAMLPVSPAGKKFYTAPSMVAASGPATASSMTFSTTVYHNLAQAARLCLQMESAITLVLRFPGLLRPDNPSHKPILDLVCSDEDVANDPPAAESEPADVKPVVAQARPAAPKAERVSGRVSGRAAAKISHIDLTDDGVQVKRQKVCTLT